MLSPVFPGKRIRMGENSENSPLGSQYEDMMVDTQSSKRTSRDEDLIDNRNFEKRAKKSLTNNETNKGEEVKKILDTGGYSEEFKGPFCVYVRNKVSSSSSFEIYKIGKILVGRYLSIQEIKREGRFKGVIIFKDRLEANNSLNDDTFEKNNLITFIPGFKKYRKGVVRGVDLNLTEEEIKAEIISPVEVLEVIRLNKRNFKSIDENDKWIPTKSVLISFKGELLPEEIILRYVISKVEPYVRRPMQCFNCYRFGHMAKSCRSEKVCLKCGEKHMEAESCNSDTPKCANCKEAHKSTDTRCKIFKLNNLLCEKMAFGNLSYGEARKLVFGNTTAPKPTKENFPDLRYSDSNISRNKSNLSFNKVVINAINSSQAQNDLINKKIIEKKLSIPSSISSTSNNNKSSLINSTLSNSTKNPASFFF